MSGKPKGGWRKGQSGNPAGRPLSSKPVKDEIAAAFAERHIDGGTKLRAAVMAQVEKAIGGDTAAFVALANRLDGLPQQQIDVDANTRITFVIGDFGAGDTTVVAGRHEPLLTADDFGNGDGNGFGH